MSDYRRGTRDIRDMVLSEDAHLTSRARIWIMEEGTLGDRLIEHVTRVSTVSRLPAERAILVGRLKSIPLMRIP